MIVEIKRAVLRQNPVRLQIQTVQSGTFIIEMNSQNTFRDLICRIRKFDRAQLAKFATSDKTTFEIRIKELAGLKFRPARRRNCKHTELIVVRSNVIMCGACAAAQTILKN